MSEYVWIFAFLIFIIFIVIIWYVLSNQGVSGPVVGSSGAVVYQPGVGFVGATTSTGTGTWSSGMLILGVFVIFIIIALIIWAVYPRRPVVVPVPPPVAQPILQQSPGTTVVYPQSQSTVTEHHHFYEQEAPMVQAPMVQAPMVQPQMVQAPMVQAPTGQYPVNVSRSVVREPDTFDPDPVTTTAYQPPRDVRGVYQHSDLGTVSGKYHQGGRLVTQTTDVGEHQVVGARRIGAGIPSGYRRIGTSVVRSI